MQKLIILILIIGSALGKTVTLSGTLRDANTGEDLIGAKRVVPPLADTRDL